MGGEAMNSVLNKLADVLDKEVNIYEGILKLSKQKTDVLVAGKVSELEGITKLEQSAILTLSKLEEEREKLVEKAAEQLKVKPSDVTLSTFIEVMPKEQAEKLKRYNDVLPKLFNEIRENNELNSKLIQNSLDYIDFSINVLTSTGSAGNYSSSGQSGDEKKNFFDLKL